MSPPPPPTKKTGGPPFTQSNDENLTRGTEPRYSIAYYLPYPTLPYPFNPYPYPYPYSGPVLSRHVMSCRVYMYLYPPIPDAELDLLLNSRSSLLLFTLQPSSFLLPRSHLIVLSTRILRHLLPLAQRSTLDRPSRK
jgi:hypothetical protein